MIGDVTEYMDQVRSHEDRQSYTRTLSMKTSPTGISAAPEEDSMRKNCTEDKKSVYATTYEVLVGVARLIAPIAPFISDEIYVNLTGEDTVHIADFPKADRSLIDENVEERMDLVRALVTLGRGTREKEKIKVRQPLSRSAGGRQI